MHAYLHFPCTLGTYFFMFALNIRGGSTQITFVPPYKSCLRSRRKEKEHVINCTASRQSLQRSSLLFAIWYNVVSQFSLVWSQFAVGSENARTESCVVTPESRHNRRYELKIFHTNIVLQNRKLAYRIGCLCMPARVHIAFDTALEEIKYPQDHHTRNNLFTWTFYTVSNTYHACVSGLHYSTLLCRLHSAWDYSKICIYLHIPPGERLVANRQHTRYGSGIVAPGEKASNRIQTNVVFSVNTKNGIFMFIIIQTGFHKEIEKTRRFISSNMVESLLYYNDLCERKDVHVKGKTHEMKLNVYALHFHRVNLHFTVIVIKYIVSILLTSDKVCKGTQKCLMRINRSNQYYARKQNFWYIFPHTASDRYF